MKLYLRFFVLCISISLIVATYATASSHIEMFDRSRERIIPTEIYEDQSKPTLPVVIINHGYTIKNTEYSFIAKTLALRGYFVVSIQHDLPNDPPITKGR